MSVDELIDAENKIWKEDKLKEFFFSNERVNKITNIRITNLEKENILRWSLTRNGVFTVNSAYKSILAHGDQLINMS